ncbi:MAG: hypothetical protein ACLFPW_03915 [Spirochaetaceae bacterium]
MVAIQRRGLAAYLLFTVALLLGLGVFGYLTLRALPESKAAAERYLMVAVVLIVPAVSGAIILFRRAQNLDRTLRIAAQRLRQGGFSTREFLENRNLGSLGAELAEIYRGMEEISQKKSLRIGSLNALNAFLLDLVPDPLLVINAKGEIFQVSRSFLEKQNAKRGDVTGRDVTKLLPEFDLDSAINHFYRDGSAIDLGTGEQKSRVFPVFDSRRELAYCVIVFGERREVEIPKQPELMVTAAARRRRFLPRLFGLDKS